MVVYIDVLLAVNLYINYFLIRGAALLLRCSISARRCLLAAAVGAVCSLVILLPALPFWANALIKAGGSLLLTVSAFGRAKPPDMLIRTLCLMVISFVYAGLMLTLWQFCAPLGMYYKNGTAYFDIPIIAIAAFTAAAYGAVKLLRYISDRRSLSAQARGIKIISGGCTIELYGIADTGNSLCDPFSGKPAVICAAAAIEPIIPQNITAYLGGDISDIDGIRLAPCLTVSGETLIPVFFADKVIIDDKSVDAVIGVCAKPMGAQCIFNPKLISL